MTIKKIYIVPESAVMQVLEPILPIMGLSGANGAYDVNKTEEEVLGDLGGAPARKPF